MIQILITAHKIHPSFDILPSVFSLQSRRKRIHRIILGHIKHVQLQLLPNGGRNECACTDDGCRSWPSQTTLLRARNHYEEVSTSCAYNFSFQMYMNDDNYVHVLCIKTNLCHFRRPSPCKADSLLFPLSTCNLFFSLLGYAVIIEKEIVHCTNSTKAGNFKCIILGKSTRLSALPRKSYVKSIFVLKNYTTYSTATWFLRE